MSKIDDLISHIKTRHIGQTGKKVLMVEGPDDVQAFQAFLNKKNPTWEQSWYVAPAHGKSKVLAVLAKEPGWLGVIDRDEWTDDQVMGAAQQHANLFVLPRFCVESYLIVPNEIWQALPPRQRSKLPNGFNDLDQAIRGHLDIWIRHAALWQVIHPLYMRMRDAGFRGDILDDPPNAPDHAALQRILNDWLVGLVPTRIATEVDRAEHALRALPLNELFTRHLYAKKFYPMVIHRELDRLLGQKSEKERVQKMLRYLPVPADLDPLWARMDLPA
ncbi:MAG: DUF4435 domain-containing protein [Rhodocyclales bacterium]|nr:DUF4435 domain-containing protein [Rhodocyclales bacterium]